MVLHNPNNWHWVNKDVSEWARDWLDTNLTTFEVKKGDVWAKITKIESMDGDVDVSQRKGKVITLFDVKLKLEYEGKAPSASEAACTKLMHGAGDAPEAAGAMGTITIPEVAHDTEESEYVVRSLLSTSFAPSPCQITSDLCAAHSSRSTSTPPMPRSSP